MRTLGKVLLLAALYFLTGKFGLLLAVPPGYATLIWPPSGLALGMMIIYGPRLWPGVLLGSFLLNAAISGAFAPEGLMFSKVMMALSIAAGSTAQALVGRILVARLVGLPVEVSNARAVGALVLLAAPVACLVAASIGTATLVISGTTPLAQAPGNWLTWWAGDVFGVLVFLPLVLIAPIGKRRLGWRGGELGHLPFVALLTLTVPLGLTFYAWKVASESAFRQSSADFAALASENERALLNRMDSYRDALLGGVGFFQGSDSVSRQEWRRYVDSLQLEKNFPGVQGLGWAAPIRDDQLSKFERDMRQTFRRFDVHPRTNCDPHYVIGYVEPEESNRQALGLDMCFEANRREAADLARDSADTVITKRIALVQDETQSTGFLLLHPMYDLQLPTRTPEERRAALRGWIYAPLVAVHFLRDLTQSQGDTIDLEIYDDGIESSQQLFYSNGINTAPANADFTVRKRLVVMQRPWLVVWKSTPAFVRAHRSDAPLIILASGLMFTGLLALFLLVSAAKRESTVQWLAEEQKLALPLTIFTIAAAGAFYLYHVLEQREVNSVKTAVAEEGDKVAQLISLELADKLLALKRMSQRWETGHGTPLPQWQADAQSYLAQLAGLRTIEWIDSTYHVRWAEPSRGNEKAIGLDVLFDEERARILKGAERKHTITLTPPLDLVQGYKGFIAYAPIHIDDRFDGFIAGVFGVQEFFDSLSQAVSADYIVTLSFAGKEFFRTRNTVEQMGIDNLAHPRRFNVYGNAWDIRVAPTARLLESRTSLLPLIVLASGLLIASLLALTVRAVLIARLRAIGTAEANRLLSLSEERQRMLVDGVADYAIYWLDVRGHVSSWNVGARHLKGYTTAEVLGRHFSLFFTEEDCAQGLPWKALEIAATQGKFEGEGWRVRKDGSRFWAHVLLEPIRDQSGQLVGFAKISHDESERRRYDQALKRSEATFRLAMERAPIGMALVDPAGRWLEVNPALCLLLGYSRDELLTTDFQSLTHPDDLAADLELASQVIHGKVDSYQMEKRYLRKDGRTVPAALYVSLVRDNAGQPAYFVSQIQDLTQQKEVERAKREFIAVVSHELRTPLTAIRGSLGLLMGTLKAEMPQKWTHLIAMAHRNSERLGVLVNDILDIEKLAAGEINLSITPVAVRDFLRQSLEVNQGYADKYQVRFELEAVPEDIEAMADPNRLMQIMANLLSNAAKFTPQGSVVQVRAREMDHRVRIEVQDRGAGIPEAFRSRIFQKFAQADTSDTRRFEGTGLGLSITRQLVEAMHGTISFDSKLGEGTTFWFELPQATAVSEHLPIHDQQAEER